MKKLNSGILRVILLLAFVSSLLLSLNSCVETDYVADRFDEYNISGFNENKFKTVERIYRDYYVEDLPPSADLAKKTTDIYFAKYHEKIDTGNKEALTEALIESYISAIGDKYSRYRTKEEYQNYDTNMSGKSYGIGVIVTYDESDTSSIEIKTVYEDGGAYLAGVKVGDRIFEVNGEAVSDIGYNKVANKIKGKENTTVNIKVWRGDSELSFTITRMPIEEKTVEYAIDDEKIGYVSISSFKDNTYSQFKEAIAFLEENGAVAVVYDLRGNPGGYLSSVVNVLSHIAPSKTKIVSFSNNYAKPMKDNDSHSLSLPSVVLCDEKTASAGELFTSAMRDFDEEFGFFDVTVVGQTTYGKGIMQSTYRLSDGSTVTLTVAYYNPPSGNNYHGDGITPDVFAEDDTVGVDSQLIAAYNEALKLVK